MTANNEVIVQEETKAPVSQPSLPVSNSAGPAKLLEIAISKDLDMEKLEKLMTMQSEWEAKEAKKAFFDALSYFQANMPDIEKTATVDFTNKAGARTYYKYAPLDVIVNTIKHLLAECGLSYRFKQKQHNGLIEITCIVSHRDGHQECTSMEAGADTTGNKNAIQSSGSTVNYLRRYTLTCALGIVAGEEDNDGDNGINAKGVNTNAAITENQINKLKTRSQEKGHTEAQILEWISGGLNRQVNSLTELSQEEARRAIKELG